MIKKRRNERAAVSIRWTLIGSVGSQVLNFGFFAVLARELGPTTFGLIALATIWVKFLNYFINQGLGLAIIQRKDLEEDHLNSVFWLSLGIATVMALGTFAFADHIAAFYSEPKLAPVLNFLSLSFIITGLSGVQAAILARNQQFKLMAQRSLVSNILGSSTAVALALAGAGVWSLVVKQLLTSVAGSILTWRATQWRPQFKFSLKHIRELWGFSVNIFLRNLVGFFYLEGDKIVVGKVIDATQLGIYSNAKQLSRMVIDVLRKPLETVALPKLSRLQSDGQAVAAAICRGQALMNAVLMPIFLTTAALAPDAIAIIFGPKWSGAALPLFYLCLAEAVNSWAALAFTALMSVNRPQLSLFHLIFTAVGSVIATLIGSHWGVRGVAIGMFINSFASTGLNVAFLCRATEVKFGQYLRTVRAPTLASVALAATAYGISRWFGSESNLYLRVACAGLAGGIAYLLVLRVAGRELYEDAQRLLLATLGLGKALPKPAPATPNDPSADLP